MNKRTLNKVYKICMLNGWTIYDDGGDWVDIRQASPAGEDFGFTVEKNNIINEIIENAESFDAEEHATMWAQNMDTVAGVPQSLRTLLDDADDIAQMLKELAQAIKGEF